MRKKYKREINLLREDVDRLEKKLDTKSDALFEQRKLIDFLLEHDRNDVVIHTVGGIVWGCSTYENDIEVEYISHIAIKRVRIAMGLCNKAKVMENDGEKIVIKTYNKDEPKWCSYYRIIKYSGEVADVTEYYPNEEPPTVANPDTPTTSCENCTKKSSCKLQNKVNFSELMPKMIVCDEFTPTETDFKYFTAEQVRNMSQKEVKENYSDIMKSMKKW